MILDLAHIPTAFYADPFPVYDRLREKAPLCWQSNGSVILSRHADLDRVYRDQAQFLSDKKSVFAPKFGEASPLFEHHTTSLVFNDPPLHSRVRTIMVGAMTPRALERLTPDIERLVAALLDQLDHGGPVDLIADFAASIPLEVVGNLLAIPHPDRAPLRGWSLDILGALEPTLSEAQLAKGHAAVHAFKTYLAGLVADRTGHPGDPDTDVLTRLISAGGLTEVELLQNCIFILNAGHETTTNLIGNALALVAADDALRQTLIADPKGISAFVEEALRLESPNQFGNRLTNTDVSFHGETVAAGTDIWLCIAAANRDPRVFDAPARVDLTRGKTRHLAFGGGAHTCVGLTLARLEGRIALEMFLRRYPRFQRLPGALHSPRVRFRGFTTLPAAL